MDGMPSATILKDPEKSGDQHVTKFKSYHEGVPIGYHSEDDYIIIFNHFDFTIKVRKIPGSEDRNRIVGFEVEPYSFVKGLSVRNF